ncbi:hypothetical protein Scep_023601 [Stephania cephalantha]|uniref:Uncharacterized protein n=1 Tax=Stephania cephalantha TaxID=152367 RepID=A0AAP0HXF4_9MAGN
MNPTHSTIIICEQQKIATPIKRMCFHGTTQISAHKIKTIRCFSGPPNMK